MAHTSEHSVAAAIGLELYFRMKRLAWLFALLVAFIGTLVVLYARYRRRRRGGP